jgi:hypothetical protein
MKKELTITDYDKYMNRIDDYIKKAETIVDDIPKFKAIRQLSFEDWIKFQNGTL